MLRLGLVGGPGAEMTAVAHRVRQLIAGDGGAGVELVDGGAHLLVGAGGVGGAVGIGGVDADVVLDLDQPSEQIIRAVDELWADRLVPFAANLRRGRRAPRRRTAELSESQPAWADQARRLIGRLDAAVGDRVRRIDHIGSTSVPGLPAKDLVDIQIVVDDLAAAAQVAERAPAAGFARVPGEWFGMDRFGRLHREEVMVDADPGRPANVNVRPVTAPVWRETLLFRDWLRTHPDERDAYAALKQDLAGHDVDRYSDDKMPWIRAAVTRAQASQRPR